MRLCRDTAAASAPFGFAIAGALLLVFIGSILLASQQAGTDSDASRGENLRGEAASLVDLFVGASGDWQGGADALTQMGLQADNGSGLDLSRIQTMKGAGYDAQANGKLDYNETLALLGLDPAGVAGFHLRVSPIALDHILSGNLDGISAAYIGDWTNQVDFSFNIPVGTDEIMAQDARDSIQAEAELVAAAERQAMIDLGLDFDDRIHILDVGIGVNVPPLTIDIEDLVGDPTALLAGDVFPDQKQYLGAQLPGRLPNYDVLVIGSNVDHSALTDNAVKSAVEDFVVAGGTLMVFGSDSQSFQWLQSVFGVGVETANGAAFTNDVEHPILNEPHKLDWSAYNNFGKAWGGQDFEDTFQHVIEAEDGDALAISKDGAYGDGRIFLTTFRPSDIAEQINIQESMRLVNNMMVYSDRDHLFLDYGPTVPSGVPNGAATRTSHVWDGDLGLVPVRISVYVWGT